MSTASEAKNKTVKVEQRSWSRIGGVSELAAHVSGVGSRTQFRPVSEIPQGVKCKVLLKTSSRIVLVGIIFENGTPGIYDFCKDRFVQREDWHGIDGWMPLPE